MALTFGYLTTLLESPVCFVCGENFECAFFEREVLMLHLIQVHPTHYYKWKRGHRDALEKKKRAEKEKAEAGASQPEGAKSDVASGTDVKVTATHPPPVLPSAAAATQDHKKARQKKNLTRCYSEGHLYSGDSTLVKQLGWKEVKMRGLSVGKIKMNKEYFLKMRADHEKRYAGRCARKHTAPIDVNVIIVEKQSSEGTTKKDGDLRPIMKQPGKEKKQAMRVHWTKDGSAPVEVRANKEEAHKKKSDQDERCAGRSAQKEVFTEDIVVMTKVLESKATVKDGDTDGMTRQSRLRGLCRSLLPSCCLPHETAVVEES